MVSRMSSREPKIIDENTKKIWNEAYDLALNMTGKGSAETALLTVGIVWGLKDFEGWPVFGQGEEEIDD